MSAPAPRTELLVRAADAGDTYLSWTWLDGARTARAGRLDPQHLDPALATLTSALPHRQPGSAAKTAAEQRTETEAEALERALTTGAFATPAAEADLSARLSAALLPPELRGELAGRRRDDRIRIRVTPSPRLAQVPWELLTIDGERRLLDIAEIVHDPPATVHAARGRLPRPWTEVCDLPPLHIIDPALPASAKPLLRNIFDAVGDSAALEAFGQRVRRPRRGADRRSRGPNPIQGEITRVQLAAALARGCSRFFYFGHVSALAEQPGSAAIHLHDTVGSPDGVWGMAVPLRAGAADSDTGLHLPLSALDLLLGTTRSQDPAVWQRYHADRPQPGHEIWPMPNRVAIIACEGGVDFRSAETFGLIIAALDAGAELVTTMRWVLPSDAAFRRFTDAPTTAPGPTTELALRVDEAHGCSDPVAALHDWQRRQLDAWRAGGQAHCSPITWAALTSTIAPARGARPAPPGGDCRSIDRLPGNRSGIDD